MVRRLPTLVVLALLPLAGCAGGDGGGEPLLVIAGPEAFERLVLRDGRDEVLWRLVAEKPAPVAQLVYGEVPPGFRQEAPAGGAAPRPLLAGEPLTLESVTPLRVFHHQGFAADDRRLSIDHWRTELRRAPEQTDADGAP